MKTITVMDPVTRIEGHMKVEIEIDTKGGQQQIVDARCTGTLFRGFETLLNGRSALDAPLITQRICGVCPISHGQTIRISKQTSIELFLILSTPKNRCIPLASVAVRLFLSTYWPLLMAGLNKRSGQVGMGQLAISNLWNYLR